MSLFKTTAAGRLGDDAEGKTTQDGKFFMTMSVAVNQWDRELRENKTRWLNVSVWGNLAEAMAKFYDNGALRKGQWVTIVGDYNPTIFVKNDGTPTISNDFRATECVPMTMPREDQGQSQGYQQPQQQYAQQPQQQYAPAPQQQYAPQGAMGVAPQAMPAPAPQGFPPQPDNGGYRPY